MRTAVFNRRKAFMLLLIIVLISASALFLYEYSTPKEPIPAEVSLMVEAFDYYSEVPLEGLPINLTLHDEKQSFYVSVVLDEGGSAEADFSSNVTLPVWVSQISVPGVWVLEKVVAERELTAANRRWRYSGSEGSNMSKYSIGDCNLLREYTDAALTLTLRLYMAKGRLIKIINPIEYSGFGTRTFFDPRLNPIRPLYLNFVDPGNVRYMQPYLAVVPDGKPIVMNLSLPYFDLVLFSSISYDVKDESLVDLTPAFIRSVSSAETGRLREIFHMLEPYGFKLNKIDAKLNRVSTLYEQGAQGFENQDQNSAKGYLNQAAILFQDAYVDTQNTYNGALGWTPTLIIILVFFSFSLSRMISERRSFGNLVSLFSFTIMISIFASTLPGFRLYIDFVFSFIFQRLNIPFFSAFIYQGLQLMLAGVLVFVLSFTQLRDLSSRTFGVSIKNLRRRRLKTLLALFTIAIVSASSMSLMTLTHERPVVIHSAHSLVPKVSSGFVVYKTVLVNQGLTYYYEPFLPYEILSISEGDWVEAVNMYGVEVVHLRRLDGFAISDYNRFTLVLVNPQFVEEYLDASRVLGSSLNSMDQDAILVGSRIAAMYSLTSDSEVFLDNRKFSVKAVFDEQKAIENLLDVDGSSLLKNIDGDLFQISGDSFILGSLNDFSLLGLSIYKVSVVAREDLAEKAIGFATDFLQTGVNYWMEDGTDYVSTYEMHLMSDGSVSLASSHRPAVSLSGNWQIQLVPIIITSLLLVTNTLGTVSERKSETRTMFTIGASPTRVRFLFILEGMTLGIIGGILGYVLGYGMAQIASIALPMVQENFISGTPFIIAFSTALVSSLIGCLSPSGASMRSALPSGVFRKKSGDMIEVMEREARLEVPIKLQREEMTVFDDFLRGLIENSFSSERVTLERLTRTRSKDKTVWQFYTRRAGHTDFQVTIVAEQNEELKIAIKPYNIEAGEPGRWGWANRNNLKVIAPLLRKKIIAFLAYQEMRPPE